MADREKVVKGLEVCTTRPCYCKDCPYVKGCALDSQQVMEDALALLKEQEPVKPYSQGDDSFGCGNCGGVVGWDELACSGSESVKYKYCPECGKAVLWDE